MPSTEASASPATEGLSGASAITRQSSKIEPFLACLLLTQEAEHLRPHSQFAALNRSQHAPCEVARQRNIRQQILLSLGTCAHSKPFERPILGKVPQTARHQLCVDVSFLLLAWTDAGLVFYKDFMWKPADTQGHNCKKQIPSPSLPHDENVAFQDSLVYGHARIL